MKYFVDADLDFVFKTVYKYYISQEAVPNYRSEQIGIDKLLSLMERIESVYYPDFFDKVTKLFIEVNKGHYFSNGNKRLALTISLIFVFLNDYEEKGHTHKEYEEKILNLFPDYKSYDRTGWEFPNEGAMYNISVIAADSFKYTKEHSELVEKIKEFFEFAFHE